MTLKENFIKTLLEVDEINGTECEQIADDFAIGFAEWFWVNKDKFYKGERDYYLEFNELLQIYKKEQGL